MQNMDNKEHDFEFGLRYLPAFSRDFYKDSLLIIDAEVSANAYWLSRDESEYEMEPYRVWLRFATHKFESRLGLQKINFGPAKLLRSLMWFDRLDPRDPLKLTEGVYGLRLRYDFENLSSIWLWGLVGNDKTKGLEMVSSHKGTFEYGGRVQYPMGPGEIGLSTHHRTTNPAEHMIFETSETTVPEQRIALDGIWDVGIGVWFESALVHADYQWAPDWQSFLTVGLDYTLPIVNGIHVLGEHMLFAWGDQPFRDERLQLSGMMASYPLNWLDEVSIYSIYSWNAEMTFHYFSYQRTLDRWLINISVFGRNGQSPLLFNQIDMPLGKFGIRLMLVFNY